MSIDKEKIKKALNDFESERYMDAKDALTGEVRKARDSFIKNKLGLKQDINPEASDDDGVKGETEGEE